MKKVGVRALKQNASAVVAEVSAGETITITDRGREVAQLVPMPVSRLAGLISSGRARAPRRSFGALANPVRRRRGQAALGTVLADMRDEERY